MDASTSQPTLTFPRETFAKLSPQSYFLAHLQPSTGSEGNRANSRRPAEARQPHVHTGSLTHAHGSAVVRIGDTTVVCGVRGEILLASDATGYRSSATTLNEQKSQGMISEGQALDLLVPNVELATGCAPEFLPGMPPSKRAQELATRIYSLLHASALVDSSELKIWGPASDEVDTDDSQDVTTEVKAFWTLYIDILFISLDGSPFDAAWAAAVAALQDLKLPEARWDADRSVVVCSDRVDQAKRLTLSGLPIAVGFSVFKAKESTTTKGTAEKHWLLIDPDAFEEGLCEEAVTVLLDCAGGTTRLLGIEKVGGTVLGRKQMADLISLAEKRWVQWSNLLKG